MSRSPTMRRVGCRLSFCSKGAGPSCLQVCFGFSIEADCDVLGLAALCLRILYPEAELSCQRRGMKLDLASVATAFVQEAGVEAPASDG